MIKQVRDHAFVFRKAVSQVNWQFLSQQLNQFESGVTPAVKTRQGKPTLFTSFHSFSLTENTSKRIELPPYQSTNYHHPLIKHLKQPSLQIYPQRSN